MDALMAAMVLAVLTGWGGAPAGLAATLADRSASPLRVALAGVAALLVASAVAASLGAALASTLTPEARDVLLALALTIEGAGAAIVAGAGNHRENSAARGGFVSLIGAIVGGGLPFVVLALAARSSWPAGAAVGATLGGGAVLAAAALLGGEWHRLPLARVRRMIGVLLVLIGIALGLGAMHLI